MKNSDYKFKQYKGMCVEKYTFFPPDTLPFLLRQPLLIVSVYFLKSNYLHNPSFLHSPLPTAYSLSFICWQSSISTNMKILHNLKESRLRSKCQDKAIYLQEKAN